MSKLRIPAILTVFILFLMSTLANGGTVDYNANCRQAYLSVYSMRFNEARQLLEKEKKINPDNVAPIVIENILDCLYLFISEDKKSFELYKNRINSRLQQIETIDDSSPYYLYCKAGFYFHWAVIRLKFGEYYTAALNFHKAYRLFEENARKFPDFLPGNIYLGLMHAAIGGVPEQYKWLASLVGFKGTLQQGVAELEKMTTISESSEYYYQKHEAMLALSSVKLSLLKDPVEAKKIAEDLYRERRSPLTAFLLADILMHNAENDKAIEVLENAPSGKEYFRIAYFDYMLGLGHLNRQDKNANQYFEKYLNGFTGINYIKASYQKLAWHSFIHGEPNKYKEYMQKVLDFGTEVLDEDKQAQTEAESKETPNIVLLKARLYFDGGYYKKALAQFSGTGINDFPTLKDQLEVTYRIARINHKMGNLDKAIEHYQETLKNGYRMTYYFAANASLQLGLIYEDKKDFEKAEFYFKKCLSLRNHEYQNSIDQKAKAGIARVRPE